MSAHPASALRQFFAASESRDAQDCSYIDGLTRKDARMIFRKGLPAMERGMAAQDAFEKGFLYDGAGSFFTPACDACALCVPMRYPVAAFRRTRTQERIWNMLPDRQVMTLYGGYQTRGLLAEHAALADRYYQARFPQHLSEPPVPSNLLLDGIMRINPGMTMNVIELRDRDRRLIGASMNVETEAAMLGMFYYYDPALMHLQPGDQITLSLLDECAKLEKEHLYVGPWNPMNGKLDRKTLYRPYELYTGGAWRRMDTPHLRCDVLSQR